MINGSSDENNSSDYGNYIIYRARLNLLTEPAESSASKCERYISGCLPHITSYTSPDYYKECILSYLKRLQDNGRLSVEKGNSFNASDTKMKELFLKEFGMIATPTKAKQTCISPSDGHIHDGNKRVSQTNRKTGNKVTFKDDSRENRKANVLQNILLLSRSLERASRRNRREKAKDINCTNDKGNEGDVSDSEPDVIDSQIEFKTCHTDTVVKRHEQDMPPFKRKLDFLDDWESSYEGKSSNVESRDAYELHSCGSEASSIFSQSAHESEFGALLDNFEAGANADDTRGRIGAFLNNWCASDDDGDDSDDLRRKITKAKLKSLRVGLVLEDMLYKVSPERMSKKEYKDKMAKCLMRYAEIAREMNAGGSDSNISRRALEECIASEEATVGKNARKLAENYQKTNNVDASANLKKMKKRHKEKNSRMEKLKKSENTEGNHHQSPEVVRRKSMRICSQEKQEKKQLYPFECYIQAESDSQYRTLSDLLNSSIVTPPKRKRRGGAAASKKTPVLKKKVAQRGSKLASNRGKLNVSKLPARKFRRDLDNKSQKRSFVEGV